MTTWARELVDRQRIQDVVLRYCRGVDRLDLDLVRSAYHPDGIDHHTGFAEFTERTSDTVDGTIDEYLAWVAPLLRGFDGTMHIVGNHLARLHGDQAVAETYGTAVHWGSPADDPRKNFTSGFRYVDLMERRDDVWAIAERYAVREWTRSDVDTRIEPEGAGPRGSRDAADPLYRLTARLG